MTLVTFSLSHRVVKRSVDIHPAWIGRKLISLPRSCLDDGQRPCPNIIQEAFVKLHGRLHNESVDLRLVGWLRKTVANAAIDVFRKTKRESDTLTFSSDSVDVPVFPEVSLAESDRCRRIVSALQKLSDKKREVFEMRVFDQMSYEDIGRILGCSVDAARRTFGRVQSDIAQSLGV